MAFTRSGVRSPSPPLARSASAQLRRAGPISKIRPLAGIAQLVEHNLAKVGVAGSSPVSRSTLNVYHAAMVELVDTRDLKSLGQ